MGDHALSIFYLYWRSCVIRAVSLLLYCRHPLSCMFVFIYLFICLGHRPGSIVNKSRNKSIQQRKHPRIVTTYVSRSISRIRQNIIISAAYDILEHSTVFSLRNAFCRFERRVPSGLPAYEACCRTVILCVLHVLHRRRGTPMTLETAQCLSKITAVPQPSQRGTVLLLLVQYIM